MTEIDISHLFKRRKEVEKFSIWYEPDTGNITGIAPHSDDDSGTYIISESDICLTLLEGNVSFFEYIIAYDPEIDDKKIMHVTEWSKLLGDMHELQVIDFISEQDNNTQFFLNFYKEQKTCELMINYESFINLFKLGNEEQISSSQNQSINFYVRDRDSGYLIANYKFEFDMINDLIMEDTADWLDDISLEDVEILSPKNFCTYNWSYQDRRIERLVRVSRTRVIPAARSNDYSHIHFEMKENKLICKSNINQPSNYAIHDDFKLWVTKRQHPDALMGLIKIPGDLLGNKQSIEVDVSHIEDFDFNDVDFLTDNQYIKVHMKEII